jgi:hypothetical protein
MPAPDRTTPFRTEAFSLKVPNGLWGYYTAEETDALVAGLAASGGTVDLSAYATTAYVDGQIATVYSKAEVDALIGLAAATLTEAIEDLESGAVVAHEGAPPQPIAPTPAAVEEAFKDLPDGLHYFKGAGSLVSITRQPFQTTVVVNGAVRSVARIVKSEAGLPTPQNPSTLVQFEADGKAMKLTSEEVNTAFGPPAMVDLFNIPSGAGGERPAVYESNTAPAGDLKDGDLWLSPATTSVSARQLATLDLSDPACAEFRKSVMDEVRKMMAGGKAVPADLDWTPCVKVAGSGLIEARVLNGMIQLRGEVVWTLSSVGTFSTTQRLPANFPKPPQEQIVVAFGIEQGVTYRRVFVRFGTDGTIAIVGDGKITSTTLTGAQAYAY